MEPIDGCFFEHGCTARVSASEDGCAPTIATDCGILSDFQGRTDRLGSVCLEDTSECDQVSVPGVSLATDCSSVSECTLLWRESKRIAPPFAIERVSLRPTRSDAFVPSDVGLEDDEFDGRYFDIGYAPSFAVFGDRIAVLHRPEGSLAAVGTYPCRLAAPMVTLLDRATLNRIEPSVTPAAACLMELAEDPVGGAFVGISFEPGGRFELIRFDADARIIDSSSVSMDKADVPKAVHILDDAIALTALTFIDDESVTDIFFFDPTNLALVDTQRIRRVRAWDAVAGIRNALWLVDDDRDQLGRFAPNQAPLVESLPLVSSVSPITGTAFRSAREILIVDQLLRLVLRYAIDTGEWRDPVHFWAADAKPHILVPWPRADADEFLLLAVGEPKREALRFETFGAILSGSANRAPAEYFTLGYGPVRAFHHEPDGSVLLLFPFNGEIARVRPL